MQRAFINEALRNEDRGPVHLLWRKCPSITSLCGGGKVATRPPDLPVERLVISHGEILNTSKSQIPQPESEKTADNRRKEKVYATSDVRGIGDN
jgi:hypothetical protein